MLFCLTSAVHWREHIDFILDESFNKTFNKHISGNWSENSFGRACPRMPVLYSDMNIYQRGNTANCS